MMTLLMSNRASEITVRRVGDLDAGCSILWIDEAKTEESEGALEVPAILQPLLRKLVIGRGRDEFIFASKKSATGHHWRDWPRENVHCICELAGLKKVCAHSMRGLSASFLARHKTVGDQIAGMLRHRDESTTRMSYAKKSALRAGAQENLIDLLARTEKQVA
jgi:integrase